MGRQQQKGFTKQASKLIKNEFLKMCRRCVNVNQHFVSCRIFFCSDLLKADWDGTKSPEWNLKHLGLAANVNHKGGKVL